MTKERERKRARKRAVERRESHEKERVECKLFWICVFFSAFGIYSFFIERVQILV